jgi:hypothetical protein
MTIHRGVGAFRDGSLLLAQYLLVQEAAASSPTAVSPHLSAAVWRRWARPLIGAVAIGLAAVLAFGGSSPVREVTRWRTQPLHSVAIATASSRATSLAIASSEADRLYVIERRGRVIAVDHETGRQWRFLDLTASGGELVDLVFHPAYARNRVLYVLTVDRNGASHVFEFTSGTMRVEPNSGAELFVLTQHERRLVSLAIDRRGDLFALDGHGTLYRLVARSVGRGAV